MKNISPHVQIYKFPITAVSSITIRLTGLALTGLFVGFGTLCHFKKEDIIVKEYEKLSLPYKKAISYTLLAPTVYHTLGGVRHFVWDKYPKLFLNNKSVAKSSFVLFGLSVPFTFFSEKLIKY
tara:strand:+ start:157 stop:525 length:369 start_codon:yes stop_codon:yes gene_type:complete